MNANQDEIDAMDVDPTDIPLVKSRTVALADIEKTLTYIVKGVENSHPRLILRAIRYNSVIRKYITSEQLLFIVNKYLIKKTSISFIAIHEIITKLPKLEVPDEEIKVNDINLDMDIDSSPSIQVSNQVSKSITSALPELEIYVFTLAITTLLRERQHEDAVYYSNYLIQSIKSYNRRSLDFLASKAFFYVSLSYERVNRLDSIRSVLLGLYRTACLHQDEYSQAMLLNLLLRNYLHYNLIDQAHILCSRSKFPENASHNQFCRYLYYLGSIQAIQGEYSESYQRLMMASRKVPTSTHLIEGNSNMNLGFTLVINKLMIIVQLLMGEIPERSTFNQDKLRVALKPYFHLTQAVRTGDLQQFHNVRNTYATVFKTDKVLTMVERLGHNVLKTGLRKLSISYSRISLTDIALKLHLESASSAEYICAKAIKDGVIEATIDHDNGWLSTTESADLYSTEEPQKVFHKRIMFCLSVHNDAVKSMRYPPDAYKNELGKKNSSSEDEEKTIEELIKELEEDEME